jgi:hypothetical protein
MNTNQIGGFATQRRAVINNLKLYFLLFKIDLQMNSQMTLFQPPAYTLPRPLMSTLLKSIAPPEKLQ